MSKLHYRLGLDVGTNSLGWCVYNLDVNNNPDKIIRMGSRIFSDGREPNNTSKAVARREARQARRLRDRSLKRRNRMLQSLTLFGLMPTDKIQRKSLEKLDPYALRKKGVSEKLEIYELGRALYHLTRKRGFQSNRKDSKKDEQESGKIKTAVSLLRKNMTDAKCSTVGVYLALLHEQRKSVKAKRNIDKDYDLYIDRTMVNDEFYKLWNFQQQFYPNLLNKKTYDSLYDVFNFRRPLHAVMPGKCIFEPEEFRERLCTPIQQKFRILSELNNIRVMLNNETRSLTLTERNFRQ